MIRSKMRLGHGFTSGAVIRDHPGVARRSLEVRHQCAAAVGLLGGALMASGNPSLLKLAADVEGRVGLDTGARLA